MRRVLAANLAADLLGGVGGQAVSNGARKGLMSDGSGKEPRRVRSAGARPTWMTWMAWMTWTTWTTWTTTWMGSWESELRAPYRTDYSNMQGVAEDRSSTVVRECTLQ